MMIEIWPLVLFTASDIFPMTFCALLIQTVLLGRQSRWWGILVTTSTPALIGFAIVWSDGFQGFRPELRETLFLSVAIDWMLLTVYFSAHHRLI